MTTMSQTSSKLDIEIGSVRRQLQTEYVDWLGKHLSRFVFKPVERQSVSTNDDAEVYIGFFEQMFA